MRARPSVPPGCAFPLAYVGCGPSAVGFALPGPLRGGHLSLLQCGALRGVGSLSTGSPRGRLRYSPGCGAVGLMYSQAITSALLLELGLSSSGLADACTRKPRLRCHGTASGPRRCCWCHVACNWARAGGRWVMMGSSARACSSFCGGLGCTPWCGCPRLGGHRTFRVSYAPLGQAVLKRCCLEPSGGRAWRSPRGGCWAARCDSSWGLDVSRWGV